MSGHLISPKILGLNDGNLGLFWAVPGQIFGLLLVHLCCCVLNYDWSVWGRNGREFLVLRSGTKC